MTCASCGAGNREGARFCDACGAALAAAPQAREQRKTVTVLFCDVAGSTALGERLDPEALRAVMARYFDVARAAIERHGGTLEKFIGDAVMAVFGVPVVREDDALRAVRAAEELRDAVDVEVRIGVNTGAVVTGTDDRSSPETPSTLRRGSSRPPSPGRCCSAPRPIGSSAAPSTRSSCRRSRRRASASR